MKGKAMQQEHKRHRPVSAHPSIRDRVGVFIQPPNAVEAQSWIREAEQAGVHQIWMDWGAGFAETLTLFAAALVQTERIRLGTSIIPTYPRHPLVMAQQALALHDLAPGRFRLGIGSGHRLFMKHWYGLTTPSPQAYLKEYLEIVRTILWEGSIDYHGTFFQVVVNREMYPFPRQAPIPLLISAIGTRAFQLAGEIADGALSALCPVPYLLDEALPALRAGAEARGRSAPPIVAHIPVVLSTDEAAAVTAMSPWVQAATSLDTFTRMFAKAGWASAVHGNKAELEAFTRTLLVSGDETAVRHRIQELLASGLDELVLQLVPVSSETRERRQLLQLVGSL
jgi:alkanesulfonate monooxygenase SsuD/methylene tetrahydromethanopterin reductase-like flavin-dependent oxidoreductase (luciferase family)